MKYPDASEWFGSDEWYTCLTKHGERTDRRCPRCILRPLVADIYRMVFAGGDEGRKAASTAWKLQDGYGSVGFTPDQGWDWSGIRDSSPAALVTIGHALGLDVPE